MHKTLFVFAVAFVLPVMGFAQEQAIVVDAGGDKTAYTGDWVTLNGTATDSDGDPIVWWSWEVVQLPPNGRYRLINQDTANLMLLGYVQGDYVVSLTAGDGTPTGFGVDFATVHVADNLAPVAVATGGPTTLTVGGTACFDGSQSYDPEQGPLTYVWDFADGTQQIIGASTCHTFLGIGIFNVVLAVTDEKELRDLDSVLVTVNPVGNQAPTASPVVTPSSGEAPLIAQFSANAEDADNDPLTYAWNFGDPASTSNTSIVANPTHTYVAAGTYVAALTISDGKASASYSVTVVVSPRLVFSVANASIKWTKKGSLASIDLAADFSAPLLAGDDLVSVSMDDNELVAQPFSAFVLDPRRGTYVYQDRNVTVTLDFGAGSLLVHETKAVLTGFDAANGVTVHVAMGDLDAIETIPMVETHADRLVYQRAE